MIKKLKSDQNGIEIYCGRNPEFNPHFVKIRPKWD